MEPYQQLFIANKHNKYIYYKKTTCSNKYFHQAFMTKLRQLHAYFGKKNIISDNMIKHRYRYEKASTSMDKMRGLDPMYSRSSVNTLARRLCVFLKLKILANNFHSISYSVNTAKFTRSQFRAVSFNLVMLGRNRTRCGKLYVDDHSQYECEVTLNKL